MQISNPTIGLFRLNRDQLFFADDRCLSEERRKNERQKLLHFFVFKPERVTLLSFDNKRPLFGARRLKDIFQFSKNIFFSYLCFPKKKPQSYFVLIVYYYYHICAFFALVKSKFPTEIDPGRKEVGGDYRIPFNLSLQARAVVAYFYPIDI